MLPKAVQLIDPAGTRETVYTFPTMTKNPTQGGLLSKLQFWKEKDPFKPDLKGYEFHAVEEGPVVEERPRTQPVAGGKPVPAVIGFEFKQAEELLTRAGFEVKFKRGQAASRKELVYRVQNQIPAPKAAAGPGETVWLTLYTPMVEQTKAETTERAKPIADFRGMFWKDAQKQLEAAGIKIKFVPGKVAPSEADLFKVYEQSPAPGAAIASGGEITLKLYNRPSGEKK